MRILHLIDVGPRPGRARFEAGGDAALLACAALTARAEEGIAHGVCLIGPPRAERHAAAAGIRTTDRITPPGGCAELAWRGLRRFVADRGRPDAVHCWSPGTLSLAWAAFGEALPRAATLLQRPRRGPEGGSDAPTGPALRLLRRALRGAGVVVLAEPAREAWGRLAGQGTRIHTAPVPSPGIDAGDRRAVRRSIGIGDDETVVLLLGDSPALADASRFAFLLGLLDAAQTPAAGLVSTGAGQLARAKRRQEMSGRSWRLYASGLPLPDLIRAADLAVLEGDRFAGVAGAFAPYSASAVEVAAAHAAGVPVLAPRSIAESGLYEGEAAAACLALNVSPPELARKLIPLLKDADLRRRVSRAVAQTSLGRDGAGFARAVRGVWPGGGSA